MTSYLRYKQQIRTVQDADDAEIESWITVRGNHIPIKKGQSKEEAVKSFLKNKGGSSSKTERKLSNGGKTIGLTQKEHNKIEKHNEKVGKIAAQYKAEGKKASEFIQKLEKKDPAAVKKFVESVEKGFGKNSPEAQKAREKYGIKPESSKKWSESWKPSAKQKQEAGFRLLEIGYNDVDFGKDPAKNKQDVLKAIKESGTENADYLTNIVKNMPDNNFSDIEKFRTGVKNAKKDFSEGSNVSKSGNKEESKKDESWGGSYPKFNELTEKYMPKTGESDNELGEVLRSINQVAYRFYNDGDTWNKGYGKETVNWAVKHLTELAKNKNTPRHIARGLENGLFEMKKYGVKDKDRYETALKILVQTMEFADKTDIESLSKIKRNTKKATDSWHKLWGKK